MFCIPTTNLRVFFRKGAINLGREISHLDSTVGRYRSLSLVKNDFLEQRLALLPAPVLRKILISGVLFLCVAQLYFVAIEQGLSRFFYLVFATESLNGT
jgi:hypothetical protein